MMLDMGMDPNDFMGGYDDPDLAALDKQLKRQGKPPPTDHRVI